MTTMRFNLQFSAWMAVLLTVRLAAQPFPPPVSGGLVDITATVDAETSSVQHDYQPPQSATILAEILYRTRTPKTTVTAIESPAVAGDLTATFSFDSSYAASHPDIIRPDGNGSYEWDDWFYHSFYQFSKVTKKTTWDAQGQVTFSLQAKRLRDGATDMIEGAGAGAAVMAVGSPSFWPTKFNSRDITSISGNIGRFQWGLTGATEWRYLHGIQGYFYIPQADGTNAVFHLNHFTGPFEGPRVFTPIGELTVAGTPGHGKGVSYQSAPEPLTEAGAYNALRQEAWTFTGNFEPAPGAGAHYAFSPDIATASMLRYKIVVQSGLARTVAWSETFTPAGASEPSDIRILTENVTATATETQVHTIDPFARFGSQAGTYQVQAFEAESFEAGLTVDANRDGQILPAAGPMTPYVIANADTPSPTKPYGFRINADDDDGDGAADNADLQVNGPDDLADFFPVFLNIKQLLSTLPAGTKCILRQSDGAVNFVYTDLKQANAFAYLSNPETGFGPDFGQPAATAIAQQITGEGVQLSEEFVNRIRYQNQGVILVEFRAPTQQPLTLTIETGTGVYLMILPLQATLGELAVDTNRDGEIKDDGSDATSVAQPYRFWINDDDDTGDVGGDDIPGKTIGANYADGVVNGTRDLVDFFPVFLDLKQLLTVLPPSASVKYKLKQADSALNFVYANLARDTTTTRDGALAYHKKILNTGLGPDFTQAAGAATTQQITTAGIELSSAFLAGAKDSDWGVLLIEGRASTTAPLVLSVEKDGSSIAEARLELRISNVEGMFRHIDLTDIPREYDGTAVTPPMPATPTRAGDPGAPYPDSATNGKYFVFVHGFNINGQRARGWNAEIFKRLYQMGSDARFVGVTWNGATGVQISNGSYTDYHQAVFHAFQTGDELAARLTSNGVTGDVTVAAHSLGNMVASQAIQYGGFSPTRYYMINAAVPLEAYHLDSVGPGDLERMTNVAWENPPLSNGNGGFFAANWYKLFAGTDDRRSELTWKQRFSNVVPFAHDFYSPGDNVVEDPTSSSPSLLLTVINQGFNSSHGAWGLQELAKGTFSIASIFFSRTQAGWGESGFSISVHDVNADPVLGWDSEDGIHHQFDLKTMPFFEPFLATDLINPNSTIASAKAGLKNVQYDVLARGIPSLSFAAAVHKLVPLDSTGRNFNMETDGRTQNQWPTEGHTDDPRDAGRWLHSDFKNVALPYVFQMYQEMINRGSLQ